MGNKSWAKSVTFIKALKKQTNWTLYLKLELHAGDVLAALHLGQLLDVGIQAPRGHLGVAAGHRFQQRIVDEAVLVLGLYHVVPLGAHERHVAVNVHRLLVLDALQHGVDDDEAARPSDSGAAERDGDVFTANGFSAALRSRQ